MRKELRDRVGRRGHFRATFRRFGVRRHRDFPEERTLLLIRREIPRLCRGGIRSLTDPGMVLVSAFLFLSTWACLD
jgi:hypothetical protein